MAKAYKCDRCGSYYDPHTTDIPKSLVDKLNITTPHINGLSLIWTPEDQDDYSANVANMDLCPVCADYILSQIAMEKVNHDATYEAIFKDLSTEHPFMAQFIDDWRPCGLNKIRVYHTSGDCYIYDYETKKLYRDRANSFGNGKE